MKRVLALSLIFVMLFTTACSAAKPQLLDGGQTAVQVSAEPQTETPAEGKYPTSWDMTLQFSDLSEWEAEFERLSEEYSHMSDYRGKLNNAQTIYEFYSRFYDGDNSHALAELKLYPQLAINKDQRDAQSRELFARVCGLSDKIDADHAFVITEIMELPLAEREKIFADPLLMPYAYALRSFTDPDAVTLSDETQTFISYVNPVLSSGISIFNIIENVDMPIPTVTAPDGTEIRIHDSEIATIADSGKYDRDFVASLYNARDARYGSFASTLAANLDNTIRSNYALARINGYESSLEYAMSLNDVDPEIYTIYINSVRNAIPLLDRYATAKAKSLGVDKLYYHEYGLHTVDVDSSISFDDGADIVLKALSVLGEDYIEHLEKRLGEGRIDAYPADGKPGGAFSTGMDSSTPYVLLNYVGDTNSVSTLAHELGHNMYTTYSIENNNGLSCCPTIFTQEVTSITNEFLLNAYLMKNASSDEERLNCLEDLLILFTSSLFRQSWFTEFEDACYKEIEQGGSLNAEKLSNIWMEVVNKYLGNTLVPDAVISNDWARVPHFHYNYYVYQYATSVCYASAIASRILNGDEGAVESYLSFLKAGCTASPKDLLAIAGVDPTEQSTYDAAFAYFESLLEQYENLINE